MRNSLFSLNNFHGDLFMLRRKLLHLGVEVGTVLQCIDNTTVALINPYMMDFFFLVVLSFAVKKQCYTDLCNHI